MIQYVRANFINLNSGFFDLEIANTRFQGFATYNRLLLMHNKVPQGSNLLPGSLLIITQARISNTISYQNAILRHNYARVKIPFNDIFYLDQPLTYPLVICLGFQLQCYADLIVHRIFCHVFVHKLTTAFEDLQTFALSIAKKWYFTFTHQSTYVLIISIIYRLGHQFYFNAQMSNNISGLQNMHM